MEKLVCLLQRPHDRNAAAFHEELRQRVVPEMRLRGARDLTLHIADMDEAMDTPLTLTPRIYGAWDEVSAAVHFWVDSIDGRGEYEALLRTTTAAVSGYLVTESVIQATPKTWADGERRPGVTQFALGRKPPNSSYEDFYHHWQDVHTPWSFALHPHRISYVRNAVARVLAHGAVPWDFIVLEHFSLNDFTDESRYYASPQAVERLWREAPDFLDLDTYAGGPMSEYQFD